MSLVRFLFGHGWWVLMYVVTHVWLLLTVVFMLLTFAQDLKSTGQAPDAASPASFFVFLICVGLGVMTACFLGVGIGLRFGPAWGVVAALVGAAIVVVADGYLNIQLAERQSVFWFGVNVVAAIAIVLANLAVMHSAINRPVAPPPLPVVMPA